MESEKYHEIVIKIRLLNYDITMTKNVLNKKAASILRQLQINLKNKLSVNPYIVAINRNCVLF